jgi:transposase-like protein
VAKQKKKHTPEQISGLLDHTHSKECPKCKARHTKVQESRRLFDGTRRRYVCIKCSHKFTLYEVSSDVYEELKWLRSKVAIIRDALGLNVTVEKTKVKEPEVVRSTSDIPCDDCCHNNSYGCSFDIPEAGTPDAQYCNLFSPINSGSMLA